MYQIFLCVIIDSISRLEIVPNRTFYYIGTIYSYIETKHKTNEQQCDMKSLNEFNVEIIIFSFDENYLLKIIFAF